MSSTPAADNEADVVSLQALEVRLTRALGAVVGGSALSRALGYRTQGAFRQALARGRLPVRVFEIEGRRGRFALTSDIAQWLWPQWAANAVPPPGANKTVSPQAMTFAQTVARGQPSDDDDIEARETSATER